MPKLPAHYQRIRKSYRAYYGALSRLGKAAAEAGPIDEKAGHLIQMAAAAAIRSEGAVHSHARRALELGAKPEELRHALLLITSTVGFPTVAAALSWLDDVAGEP
ncbi:MAG: carboxymuconolactone decarboxylase family protein [Thermodesulfovibrionales bacterium]